MVQLIYRYFDGEIHDALADLEIALADEFSTAAVVQMTVTAIELEPGGELPEAPAALLEAERFIQQQHGETVSIEQIAASVHVSPRTLFNLFRSHRDTTPAQFLRSVRLDAAHTALQAADARDTTVAAIAQEHGLQHAGRFAVSYQERFGQAPSTTLRAVGRTSSGTD